MKIVGISAYYHDSAAALLVDGEIIAAAQEERFTRKKHDPGFPHNALKYCLEEAGIRPGEIDRIVFYDKPFIKFERLLQTYVSLAPHGFQSFKLALPVWVRDKLFLKTKLIKLFKEYDSEINWEERMLFAEHHLSHAASAFYASPFEEAAVLTMDGVGEWATTSLAVGKGNDLKIHKEIHFPHSLGLLYSAFTYYLGFKVNSGEYKIMGLAPYGRPVYKDKIMSNIVDMKSDGSYRLSMKYFDYCTGLRMTSPEFHALFGGEPRESEGELTQREMDLAASVQAVTEEVVLQLSRGIRESTGLENLCLAGGVALNCVANGKLLKEKIFKRIWIQPAGGDAGGALGAAYVGYHGHLGKPRTVSPQDAMKGAYLGPKCLDEDIEKDLKRLGASFTKQSQTEMINTCVEGLSEGKAIGWHQGRMEFGPRALGARSIIGDSRSEKMQSILNLKVKFRESFRPFASSILREKVNEWFDMDEDSPYMLLVVDVQKDKQIPMSEEDQKKFGIDKLNVPRSKIPASTHVDYSARVQTVHKETNPIYHELLSRFNEKTGCPVLINTSFNIRGEPIVCSTEDAFRCFMGTDLDLFVVGNYVMRKDDQNKELQQDYRSQFALD